MENNKKINIAGLVLGILSIPCGLIIAMLGWILGIIGIVINAVKRDEYNTRVGLILSIVGTVLSTINSVLGALINLGVIRLT